MPTVLKALLAERNLDTYGNFLAAYDRCAGQLDPPVPPGYGPAKAQYYQWLSGRMVGLPRDCHRRVLRRMFPGWTVEGLFQMVESAPAGHPAPEPNPPVDGELETFLGGDMVTRGVTLVYPSQSDIPVVPEGDMRGLLYVSALLQRHTGIRTEFCADREAAARGDRAHVGFGLYGVQRCLHVIEHPLFAVRANDPADGLDHLELRDGTHFDSGGRHHIGAITRLRPSPFLHPDRYWFHCVGLGPRGAAGAGWYFAHHWRHLHRRAGDREFVAVIAIRAYSDQTAGLRRLVVGHTRTRPIPQNATR
ncbi:hypothetical protein [Nocardia arizonensis]|uniref:hypothetical protein n=1 Tax=Nocardia arizonensis TaxID=1141647 RepID=UPI0007A7539F|nr:hypothetical protein [Nocardia arizonensis]